MYTTGPIKYGPPVRVFSDRGWLSFSCTAVWEKVPIFLRTMTIFFHDQSVYLFCRASERQRFLVGFAGTDFFQRGVSGDILNSIRHRPCKALLNARR